jgi:hypothetical protein
VRSIAAVLAGFITFSVALYAAQSLGTALLTQMHPDLPATTSIVNYSTGTRILWLVWETMSMAAAGYVTARIAGISPITHATVMGSIQAVVTLWAMLSVRNDEPLWFWLAGIASMVPAASFGGWFRVKRSA